MWLITEGGATHLRKGTTASDISTVNTDVLTDLAIRVHNEGHMNKYKIDKSNYTASRRKWHIQF